MSKHIIQYIVALAGKNKKPKQPQLPVIPPKGAPTNLRPGGAHGGERDKPRGVKERKAIEESRDGW